MVIQLCIRGIHVMIIQCSHARNLILTDGHIYLKKLHQRYIPWRIFVKYLPEHDDVIKWKHFPRYWKIVRGIHRWPVNSPHKGQCRGVLMFSLMCAWINDWVNNGETGDLRRHGAHYDVTVMKYAILHKWYPLDVFVSNNVCLPFLLISNVIHFLNVRYLFEIRINWQGSIVRLIDIIHRIIWYKWGFILNII